LSGAGIGSTGAHWIDSDTPGLTASKVGYIFIHDGNITVAGSSSDAGIGRGHSSESSVGPISITGGSISVLDGIVGVGAENASPSLTIGSPDIDCRSIGAKTCLKAVSVVFSNGSFTAVTGASNLIESTEASFSTSI
jgi:hypothetical protein